MTIPETIPVSTRRLLWALDTQIARATGARLEELRAERAQVAERLNRQCEASRKTLQAIGPGVLADIEAEQVHHVDGSIVLHLGPSLRIAVSNRGDAYTVEAHLLREGAAVQYRRVCLVSPVELPGVVIDMAIRYRAKIA